MAKSSSSSTPTTEKNEKKFTLKSLSKDSRRLFGVSNSTFAGATNDLAEGEYTVDEVKKHIEEWGKREVK